MPKIAHGFRRENTAAQGFVRWGVGFMLSGAPKKKVAPPYRHRLPAAPGLLDSEQGLPVMP